VSRAIVGALKLKLTAVEECQIAERPVANVQAYDCYLRARSAIQTFTEQETDEAVRLLKKGLQIIGDNALLYAGLGYAHFQYVNIGIRPEESAVIAEDYAHKALGLDPSMAQAHLVLGLHQLFYCGNPRASIFHFTKALSFDPNDYDSLYWLAVCYALAGRTSECLPLAQRAVELDPLNPMSLAAIPLAHFYAGRFDMAAELMKCDGILAALDLPAIRFFLVYFLAYAKRVEEALQLLEPVDAATDLNLFAQSSVLLKYALQGKRQPMTELLTPELAAAGKRDCQNASILAIIFAIVDDRDQAFYWIEQAVNQGFINYPFLNEYDPFLSGLRSEPRFKMLMQRVKREWEEFRV
jgi:tetratricopeptide (TPR) repeat protein